MWWDELDRFLKLIEGTWREIDWVKEEKGYEAKEVQASVG